MSHASPVAPTPDRIVIGLDIGGSKTRGIRIVGGAVAADRTAGSANTQNVSTAEAARNLAGLLGDLGAGDAGAVYVGAGGVDTPGDQEALRSLIAPHAPNAPVTIVHDSRLILAAAGLRTGIAVIAGTGSAACGVNADGDEARAGGWGYLLGDEGSGYWLAREAVRHALHRANLGMPEDDLTAALLRRCSVASAEELIRLFHVDTDRTYWADKSRTVFDCAARGDLASQALVQQAGQYLAEQALQVAARLMMSGPVILGGGLGLNQPALAESFTAHLSANGLTDVRILATDPVFGVLYVADGATA